MVHLKKTIVKKLNASPISNYISSNLFYSNQDSCLKQKNLITLFPGNFGRPNPQLSRGRSRALSIVLLQARNPQSPGQEVSGPPAA